jgi:hypothetical protein
MIDVIVVADDRVVIKTSSAMEDWRATRYRRTAIVFRGRTYYVESVHSRGGRWEYHLALWSEGLHDAPSRVIYYDESYVLEREARRASESRHEVRAAFLYPIAPLLGFLPSAAKLALNDRYGWHPLTVTNWSLLVEYVGLLWVSFLLIFRQGWPDFIAGVLWVLAGTLLVDLVARHSTALGGGMRQYGFLEWLFKRARSK